MYQENQEPDDTLFGVQENQSSWALHPLADKQRLAEDMQLADDVAFFLWRTSPLSSAGEPIRLPWGMLLAPLILAGGFCFLHPRLGLLTLSVLLLAGLLTMAGIRLLAALVPVRERTPPHQSYLSLPTMSVLVPLYREARVVDDLARSLARLDYPRDRLEILFLLEVGDHETLAAAREAARHHTITVLPIFDVGPKTKPKALNYGLKRAKGDFIAVYDAEDAPHPGQLRAAVDALMADDQLACVQSPLGWYNRDENWLTRQFALEYATQFHSLLPLLDRMKWPIPLGGTSNVFRRSALENVGAWDPFNVTEDADLGFRMARQGWRTSVITPPTLEEAPITVKAWTAQRSRWLKGHLISWAVQMRKPAGLRKGGGGQAVPALHLTLGVNVLSALVHGPTVLLCVGLAIWRYWNGDIATSVFPLATLLAGYLAAMIAASISARRAGIKAGLFDILTMPFYWLLQLPAMIRALRELPSRPYLWAKTEHGLSRKPRRSPDEP